MIDTDEWMATLVEKLRDAFSNRLLYVGLQGSYQRGEATEHSDIDIVAVIDGLTLKDLARYRAILATMTNGDKACGFICGADELAAWPKYEIFQLVQDTRDILGRLSNLTPPIERQDLRESAKIGVANLYHTLCHAYLYDDDANQIATLKSAYKNAFFLLQQTHYLESGEYVRTRTALLSKLKAPASYILATSMAWSGDQPPTGLSADDHFAQLIEWTGNVLKTI